MRLTGGHDVCIELSGADVTARATAGVAGLIMLTNGERDIGVMQAVGDHVLAGELHLFITSLRIEPVESTAAHVDVVLQFRRSALRIDTPREGSVDELGGQLIIRQVPVTIDPADDPVKLGLNLDEAERVDLAFREGASSVANLFRLAGVEAAAAQEAVESAALEDAMSLGRVAIATPFRRAAAGEEGDLAGLVFVDIDVTTRSLPQGGGVLCLLATLRRDAATPRDRASKTEVALRRGFTSAVALSSAAVDAVAFCPAAFKALLPRWLEAVLPGDFLRALPPGAFDHHPAARQRRIRQAIEEGDASGAWERILAGQGPGLLDNAGALVTAALPAAVLAVLLDPRAGARTILPTRCGGGETPVGSSKLVALSFDLGEGIATISGRAVSTHVLVDGHVDFGLDVRLVVRRGRGERGERGERGQGKAELDLESLGEIVFLPDFTPSYLAVELILPTLGLSLLPLAGAEEVARTTVTGALRDALDSFVSPELPTDLGPLADVAIVPGAVVLCFLRPVAATPFRLVFPSLAMSVTETRVRGTPGKRETVRLDDKCHHGEYSFRDVPVQTVLEYAVTPTQLDPPIRTIWTVAGNDLTDRDGVLPFRVAARLTYSISPDGQRLTLRNDPDSETFSISVACRAVDANGLTAAAPPRMATFQGAQREWDPPYEEQSRACIMGFLDELGRGLSERPRTVRGIGPITIERMRRQIIRPNGTIDQAALRSLLAISKRRIGPLAALLARSRARHG